MSIGKSAIALAIWATAAVGTLTLSCNHAAAEGIDKSWAADASSIWSGVYIGGSLGGARGEAGFVVASGLTVNPNPMDLDGALAGGFHLGIQRQWGRTVAGIETSVLFGDFSGTSLCPNDEDFCSVDGSRIWMIGPRLGFAASNLHFYATGGYALGRLTSKAVDDATGALLDSGHARHDGWYLGGGVEWSFRPNVILGAEYRRIELGADTHSSSAGIAAAAREIDATIDTVQARLTFKMGH